MTDFQILAFSLTATGYGGVVEKFARPTVVAELPAQDDMVFWFQVILPEANAMDPGVLVDCGCTLVLPGDDMTPNYELNIPGIPGTISGETWAKLGCALLGLASDDAAGA